MKVLKDDFVLLLILFLAFFLRVYRLYDLMSFWGDVARDFVVARDITLKGELPLLGCPSSVPWLHQGAFFIYLLSLPLFIGRYHPLAGGYFIALLGVLATFLLYKLGKGFFSQKAGLWVALFYAASPLTVLYERLPYHLSPISLFTILFFLSLHASFKKSKYFILSAFIFGLLLQLELSNLVLLPILAILFLDFKKEISLKFLLLSFLGFLVPWLPKIIYDLKAGFSQTLGFVAWALHKILPFEFLLGSQEPGISLGGKLGLISTYFSRIMLWQIPSLALVIFLILSFLVLRNFSLKQRKNQPGLYLSLLWLVFPILVFLIQGSPSESYMPVLFPLPALLFGVLISSLKGLKLKLAVSLSVLIVGLNIFTLFSHEFFLITKDSELKEDYNWGPAISLDWEVARFIINDGQGQEFNLIPLGTYAYFPSFKQTLTYLSWYLGHQPSDQKTTLKYFVYSYPDKYDINRVSLVKKFPYLTVAKRTDD